MGKNRTRGLAGAFARTLELPEESISGVSSVTLTGKGTIRIESHSGLTEYDSNLIGVNCGSYTLGIYGSKLVLETMNDFELVIRGDIQRLEIT